MSDFKFDKQKLFTYLNPVIPGLSPDMKIEKFAGGQSNPTFLLQSGENRYVLRRKPPGELLKSAHAVDREFRIMKALSSTNVPVAKVYHLCEDHSIIGSMFYVMEFINGTVFWDPALPELAPEQRFHIYEEMNLVLANLHKVNIEEVGLSDFGKAGNYYSRQISRWTSQYRASQTEDNTDMDQLIDWLAINMPEDDGRVSITHGDFRLDNMLIDSASCKVLALVDWELSTLGHPYADLAYQCMQLRMARDGLMKGLGNINRKEIGIPTESEYVALYCKNMGIDKIKNWNFYLAFSFFRLAAILEGVKRRAIDGNASSAKAMEMGALVKPLAREGASLCF